LFVRDSLIALGVVALVMCGACRRQARPSAPPIASGALRQANVLLVTIDTLRADYVGAYGSTRGATPTLDRLAAEGLRFDVVYAHVPLTLPSHTTLLTGRYPTRTGVRDNGTFTLGDMPTLSTALKATGYDTAAFIGAFVLDARFGLNRGFDLYDDRMIGGNADLDIVQRTAEEVLAPAYDWIARVENREPRTQNRESRTNPGPRTPNPWFVWIHLYDPHEPYTPPEPYRSRYAADPYAGEIAYADASLGAFFEKLRANGVLSNLLVVVASDHGESLGEHSERTHGLFAYDSTLRVPLVVWAPGRIPAGALVRGPMRLVDVAPTILDLVGGPLLDGLDGRSVRFALTGEMPIDDGGSYFEALNASLARNWAPLRGVVRDGLKLIDLPLPELYDLAADPGERRNLYAQHRDLARPLEARLDAIERGAGAPAAPRSLDADAEARLRALGYVVSSAPKPARAFAAADDPKQLVHLDLALDEAAALSSRGDAAGAIATLEGVIKERPDLVIAYDRLAFILRAIGRPSDAAAVLDRAARDGHADRTLLASLGSALRDAGELRRAAAVLEDLVRTDRSDLRAADALGQTYARLGRGREAEALFKRVIAGSPSASATWNNLGALYLVEGRSGEARAAFERAIAINPALAAAHNGLGVALARGGQMDRAITEWQRALELRPEYADARRNLERARK
jgi:arylsulfatase A-like enzyme/Flp pilus assembly protein TadD